MATNPKDQYLGNPNLKKVTQNQGLQKNKLKKLSLV